MRLLEAVVRLFVIASPHVYVFEQLASFVYARFFVDVADMRVDCMGRDDQFGGDAISSVTFCEQAEYLGFAVG